MYLSTQYLGINCDDFLGNFLLISQLVKISSKTTFANCLSHIWSELWPRLGLNPHVLAGKLDSNLLSNWAWRLYNLLGKSLVY